jgi:glycerol-3-phosphate dehydrogenase (NAD(P)+)
MATYAVVGATSWGTTLAWLLARNGHHVSLVARDDREARQVDSMRGIGRLPGLVLPPLVSTCAPGAAPADPAGVIVAVPAQAVRSTLAAMPALQRVPALSAAKGIELTSGLRMTQVLTDLGWRPTDLACLSGPNLSHEIARSLPAAAVVGAQSAEVGAAWQKALSGGAFRVYHTDDVVGVELGGALKNVIAIAAGAAVGLGMGANTVAAILTRGLAEVTRLGVALGARQSTFLGLAGVGDMAATCYSPLSRNRQLGELLARGHTPSEAVAEIGEAVEGMQTAPVALELARRNNVAAPITEQVCAVLSGAATVAVAMAQLLARPPRAESNAEA